MDPFDSSLAVEARFAPLLDAWLLKEGFRFRVATEEEQWDGIDRVVSRGGETFGVKYKVDTVAIRTGNVFIETVSNNRTGRPGWAHTTKARYVLYLIAGSHLLYFCPERLREALPGWQERCTSKATDNGTYHTIGVCVPLRMAEAVAYRAVAFEAHPDKPSGPADNAPAMPSDPVESGGKAGGKS